MTDQSSGFYLGKTNGEAVAQLLQWNKYHSSKSRYFRDNVSVGKKKKEIYLN